MIIKCLKAGAEQNEKQELINIYIKYPFEKSAEELKEHEPELFGAVLAYLDMEEESVPETLKQKVAQYEKNEAAIAAFVEDLKILKFLVSCSVKLLTTKKDIELKYSDIEKFASNNEVEVFVCDMMGRNLIECKMNQLDQTINVQSVKCRGAAHKSDWKNLESLVSAWTNKLSTVFGSLNTNANPQQFKTDVLKSQQQ